ncbi:AAA family ATPase [Hymenobacter sp. HMF4947]|uniref:AAA family ATPase n=1 Tax=Hymenobacter ginkgonis TaxID=2682976 RepID=A0A7K1THA3_9BACT|nr:AAA family ATPase [Hymenobacter ginkgonis]MVN77712.1 AAA family ATPase [Hymenobacter ginkgonis]
MKKSQGSTWKKWDLHFHTPASFDYKNKSITNEEIIQTLQKNEIAAVAITDHHTMDVARIRELQQLGKAVDITIFPGIELRSDKGGSDSIHFIGIFPEDCNLDHVWTKLSITPADIAAKGGDEGFFCLFEPICAVIHQLGGLVSIHAGKKSNSVESITSALSHKMAQKRDMVDHIDIYEIGQTSDIEMYEQKVFPHLSKRLPLILCSDNHDIRNYSIKAPLWIKADNTFEGLKQIIHETDRVFVGETPEILRRVKNNPTKYIKTIKVSRISDAKTKEKWFENISIDINSELVTIIGNKGHGKSALLDIVALLGNVKGTDKYSFLTNARFKRNNKASNFKAEIIWHDGNGQERPLDYTPDNSSIERVKYIPQQFLEKLCNEQEAEFLSELKKVIFSHIPDELRQNTVTIDELLSNKSEILLGDIETIKLKLNHVNTTIVSLEKKTSGEHIQSLRNLLTNKKQELLAVEALMPEEVLDPALSNDTSATAAISAKITEIIDRISDINHKIFQQQQSRKRNNTILGNLQKMLQEVDSFVTLYENHKTNFAKLLQGTSMSFEQLIHITTNKEPIKAEILKLKQNNTGIEASLDVHGEPSLLAQLNLLQAEKNRLEQLLDAPSKAYQQYLTDYLAWRSRIDKIQGHATQDGTITYYEEQVRYIEEELRIEIDAKRAERLEVAKEIFNIKLKLTEIYSELYQPVTLFMDKYRDILKNYPISLNVSLKQKDLEAEFFSFVTHSAKGSFCGRETGQEQLKSILRNCDFSTFVGCQSFLDAAVSNLEFDTRPDLNNAPREIHSQIRIAKETAFYNFLFELDYLEPTYALMLADKDISQLSPGEKGALLLIFYLTLDKADTPLLIDQPEENLDNQSVYEILVPFIKKAKLNRQIIIVTHNPNIAVVCDSEQVISTSIDKFDGNKVEIISGAIENSVINGRIVKVLEGTMPAFAMRSNKYSSIVNT